MPQQSPSQSQQPYSQGQNSQQPPNSHKVAIVVASIGAAATIFAAIVGGIFLLLARQSEPPPTPTVTLQSTLSATNGSSTLTSTPPTTIAGNHILYLADFAQGGQGWLNNSLQWSYDNTNKVLASNGNSQNINYLKSPYQPQTANYAVEAQIQFVKGTSTPENAYFGIFVRSVIPGKQGYDGYLFSGDSSDSGDAKIRIADDPNSSKILGNVSYPLDTSWHTYRVEVQGSTITFFIDNQNVVQATNNKFTSPGLIGLLDGTCQINVRSFTVFSL